MIMKIDKHRLIFLALYSGIFAASCWTIADILLVGFTLQPEHYPLFSRDLSSLLGSELDIAILMLSASPTRLFYGVIFATFSMVFYLFSTFAVYQLFAIKFKNNTSSNKNYLFILSMLLLFFGYSLSPLGHAGFYYVGLSAQTLLHSSNGDYHTLIQQFQYFHHILLVHWSFSVGVSFIAWLLIMIQIWQNKTILPRHIIWFTPIPIGIIIASICSLFPKSILMTSIGSATFNLAQLIFFIVVLFIIKKKHLLINIDKNH